MINVAAMADLRIVADSADPAELLSAYEAYTVRYERLCDDIDSMDRRLRFATDHREGQRLAAELGALTEDSAIALGWVAAAFAAYIFASYRTTEPSTSEHDLVSLVGRSMTPRRTARGGAR